MRNKRNKNKNKNSNSDVVFQKDQEVRPLESFKPRTENQKKLITEVLNKDVVFSIGPPGVGKSQPHFCRVLTDVGFVQMKDLTLDHKIVDPNSGRLKKLNKIYPQGNIEYYKITFEDDRYTYCSLDHLWQVNEYDYPVNLAFLISKFSHGHTIPLIVPLNTEKKSISGRSLIDLIEFLEYDKLKEIFESHVIDITGNDIIHIMKKNISMNHAKKLELIQSEIWKAGLMCKLKFNEKTNLYSVCISDSKKLKIKKIEEQGSTPCFCIEVNSNSHLYITDSYIITHNTFLSAYLSVKFLEDKKYDSVVIMRPAVETKNQSIGFLPGNIEAKLGPYLVPIYENMEKFISKNKIRGYKDSGKLKIKALSFLRGNNLENSFIIIDECQNLTHDQLYLILTRLGENSKMLIDGDWNQTDLPYNEMMKTRNLVDLLNKRIPEIGYVEFEEKDIQRHQIVKKIFNVYDDYKKNSKL